MDLHYSAADQDFRARAREWLAGNVPQELRPTEQHLAAQFDRDWQRKMYDHGWAGVAWPKAFGGLGLTGFATGHLVRGTGPRPRAPLHQRHLYRPDARWPNPDRARHGRTKGVSPAQDTERARALWCQGFSEPNAGSDLAALKSRGQVDGDHIVVNGAKMWTTDAQHADYQELLIRTDGDAERHKGLTWVICDMKSPGIDIKPIRTMMQDEHVNMVFYDNVRVPRRQCGGRHQQGLVHRAGDIVVRARAGLHRRSARIV